MAVANKTITVKLRAVDRSTIQFWNFLAKGHSTHPIICTIQIRKKIQFIKLKTSN